MLEFSPSRPRKNGGEIFQMLAKIVIGGRQKRTQTIDARLMLSFSNEAEVASAGK